jgi:hypothetical protein
MDQNGIGAAVLSVSSPALGFVDGDAALELARSANESARALITAHPDRFGAFALLPLPDVDASLREIAHALDTLGLDGVGVLTNYAGAYLGDRRFAPLFDNCCSASIFRSCLRQQSLRRLQAWNPSRVCRPTTSRRSQAAMPAGCFQKSARGDVRSIAAPALRRLFTNCEDLSPVMDDRSNFFCIRGNDLAAASRDNCMRLRDELWFKGREWFQDRACSMPKDDALIAELTAPTYSFTSTGKMVVESKADMKKRGMRSPDLADAFLLTFACGERRRERYRKPVRRCSAWAA